MEDIVRYYEQQDEDSRLKMDRAHSLEYLTTIKYLDEICHGQVTILDACAGTGAYCFYLAEKGHSVTAGDIASSNVNIIKEKQKKNPVLHDIYTGDILNMYPKQLQSISEKEFSEYLNYHYDTCENTNILGYSLHGLFIGEK